MFILFVLFSLGLFSGCYSEENILFREERVNDIVRILMHQSHEWTLITQNQNSTELIMQKYNIMPHGGYFRTTEEFPAEQRMITGSNKEEVMRYYRENGYMHGYVKLISDCQKGQKMWVRIVWENYAGNRWAVYGLELHVHSEKNIEGGSWDKGKLGKGMTQIIE